MTKLKATLRYGWLLRKNVRSHWNFLSMKKSTFFLHVALCRSECFRSACDCSVRQAGFLRRWQWLMWLRNYPPYMEPEGSLQSSKRTVNETYPELQEGSTPPQDPSPKTNFKISLYLRPTADPYSNRGAQALNLMFVIPTCLSNIYEYIISVKTKPFII